MALSPANWSLLEVYHHIKNQLVQNLYFIKLVSHWHANFSRLFCKFCHRLSNDICASVMRIFMCRELVAKVLNMLKNFMRIFGQNISQDCHATVVQCSCECCKPAAEKILDNLQCKIFRDTHTNVIRRSHDSLVKTCKHLATMWQENKTKRHS